MPKYLPKFLILILINFALLTLSRNASAQTATLTEEWNGPVRLSRPGNLLASLRAATVADSYGNGHVFWIEERSQGRVITYAQFDGVAWSPQLDLFVPAGGHNIGTTLSASINDSGTLHLSWIGFSGANIYFTSVPAHQALSIRAWEDVRSLQAPAFSHELHVDTNGVHHLVTSRQGALRPGLYYRQSLDGGETWSEEMWLSSDIPAGYIPDTFQFLIDAQNRLHVVWSEKEELGTILGAGRIRYTRSTDGGNSWPPPTDLDVSNDGTFLLDNAEPSLVVHEDTAIALWAGGELQYRNQSISTDGGAIWSEPVRKAFGELHGQAQGEALLTDDAGGVHYIGHIRWPDGMYYLRWDADASTTSKRPPSDPNLFYLMRRDSNETAQNKVNAHGVRATLLRGNHLLATFYDRAENGDYALYAMSTTLGDDASAPIQPAPTYTGEQVTAQETTTTPAPTDIAATPAPTTTPAFQAAANPTTSDGSPAALLAQAILPALVVIVAAIAFSLRRR